MGKESKSNILEQLRNLIRDVYDTSNNVVRNKPVGRFLTEELSDERMKAIKDLVHLCMDTEMFNLATRLYLRIPYAGYSDIVKEIKYATGINTNYSTVQSNIFYSKQKIIKELGENIVLDLVVYTDSDISVYQDRIATALLKANKQDILSNIRLPFSKETKYCDSMEDDEFDACMDIIYNYTNVAITDVVKTLEEGFVGYVRYISTHNDISAKDRERLRELSNMINRPVN